MNFLLPNENTNLHRLYNIHKSEDLDGEVFASNVLHKCAHAIEAITTGEDYSWDNNLIERINRYISLSRKNSLFFGNHAGDDYEDAITLLQ